MEIPATLVKELRFKTGAGIMQCKEALIATEGEIDEAIKWLREKGVAAAAKRIGRETKEGLVYSYIHPGSRIGVMLELNCETDFVAKNPEFEQLAKDVAMQVAASSPQFVTRDQVPEGLLEAEKDILRNQAIQGGKPAQVVDKIVTGRIEKYYGQVCLMEQPFVKDMNRTVQDIVTEAIAKFGENMAVRRFVRYQLGGELALTSPISASS